MCIRDRDKSAYPAIPQKYLPDRKWCKKLKKRPLKRALRDVYKRQEEDILTQCYEEFTRKHWDKFMQKLGISEDTLQQAVKEICKLHPCPGA